MASRSELLILFSPRDYKLQFIGAVQEQKSSSLFMCSPKSSKHAKQNGEQRTGVILCKE